MSDTNTTPAADGLEASINVLRTERARVTADTVENGTMVRFWIEGYVYAAVHANGSWYLTGLQTSHVDKVYRSTAVFVEKALAKADRVEVATAFQAL